MYDLLIRNGALLDGTGVPWFKADLAVVADKIVAIGRIAEQKAVQTIDAAGRFVAPGFVEEHSHSDVTFLVDPLAQSAVRQGITTMAVGLCGMSASPLPAEFQLAYRQASPCFSFQGYSWSWQRTGEYLAALRAAQPAVNVLSMVGHLPLRLAVMDHAGRPADAKERAKMRALLAESLAEGARGFTTGLNYQSSPFADTEEITEIVKALRPYGWAYHTHMRSYGARLLQSIEESIQVAEKADVPLVISHMYPSGRDHWGKAARAIELVENARRRGLEVGYDVTPWLRGGGPIEQIFPPWVREGGVSATLDRIRNEQLRARLAQEIEQVGNWDGWLRPEWDDWLVCRAGKPQNRGWMGRTIAEIAAERHQPPVEAALLMFVEDEAQYWIAPTNKCDADIDLLLKHPSGVPIADGFALAPEGPLAFQDRPNSYGTFPRVLGRYVRERKLLTWEEAVHKITAVPAGRLGLWDRGLLRPGLAADIVIFDPETVKERADYARPQEFPDGISWVVVNGKVAVTPEGQTGVRAGKVTGA